MNFCVTALMRFYMRQRGPSTFENVPVSSRFASELMAIYEVENGSVVSALKHNIIREGTRILLHLIDCELREREVAHINELGQQLKMKTEEPQLYA